MLHVGAIWLTTASAVVCAGPGQSIDAEKLAPFRPISVRTTVNEPTVIDLPGGAGGRQYMVVVGSPNAGDKASVVRVDRGRIDTPESIVAESSEPDAVWLQKTERRRSLMSQRRLYAEREPAPVSVGKISPKKTFHLFIKDGAFHDAANYQAVNATLAYTGARCLLYVDDDDQPEGFSKEVLEEVAKTFDDVVQPKAAALFGRCRDVDRNGRFTILFSHWLGDLSGGKVSIGGFVRGGDFYRDVEAPYSNQCDMLYLNSTLRPGKHLRTLVAHEYVHAVTFCEHVFGEYLPGEVGMDEEGWLNEAVSHLAENLFGDGWSNLDYRVSAYLSAPHRYRLVVPDYYRAGLFRNHGCRGATYLFLRWCVDRYGEGILKELTQSSLTGTENVETACKERFDALFRQWTTVLALQGMTTNENRSDWLPSVKLRDRLGDYLLAGPRTSYLPAGGAVFRMEPTSFLPFRVAVGHNQSTRLTIESPDDAPLQITLIRLPDDAPAAEIDVAEVSAASRSAVTAHSSKDSRRAVVRVRHLAGGPVRWERLSWEREFLPQVKESDEMPRPGSVRAEEAFAMASTKRGDVVVSDELAIPAGLEGNIVFKLVGTDQAGRRVSAWGSLNGSTPLREAPSQR
jgi:hypothetical protein